MASEKNLHELFHETLKDIYFAEKKILSALPKMAKDFIMRECARDSRKEVMSWLQASMIFSTHSLLCNGRSRRASAASGSRHGTAAGGSYPPVNIFQQGDDFIAVVEVPGVSKDDLAIEVKENTIRISGRKAIDYGEGVSVHRRERLSGVFDRSIALPIDINPDAVRAEYHDGVLALFVPRAE